MRLGPRTVGLLHKYLLNPPMRPLVWLGLFPHYGFLETKGRRTGKRRRALVAFERDGEAVWVVALLGRGAAHVRNIEADPDVRVRVRRHWIEGRAEVRPDDDAFGGAAHGVSAVIQIGRRGSERRELAGERAAPGLGEQPTDLAGQVVIAGS